MTRVLLIKAGPTPWDLEKRISGNVALPLTEAATTNLPAMLQTLPKVDAVYHCKSNDACHQVAKLIAAQNNLKARDNEHLESWCLGLWQGLRMEDLRQRYPTVLEQWEDSPEKVVPPEGESFIDAIARLRDATRKILRRNRGYTIALVLRPTALQIVAGILRMQTPQQIASHLQNDTPVETIEMEDEALKKI
jgi:broad specificity phosphatase PhoE